MPVRHWRQPLLAMSRRHEIVILACAVWAIHAPLEMWILNRLAVIPLLWALHGFALMLAMGWLLALVLERRSLAWGVAALVLLPIGFAAAQTAMDVLTTYWVGDRWLGEMQAPPPAVLLSGDPRVVAALKLTFEIYLWPFGFYSVALLLMSAVRDAYEARLSTQRAELEALRLQLNPHFLFNTLNSLTSLIVSGRSNDAQEMTLSLARFYRNNLMSDVGALVELGDELDALQAYVDLERLRLGDALTLAVDCPDELMGSSVPPMMLQPLLENAVKYGGPGKATPLTVLLRVAADNEALRITTESVIGPPDTSIDGTGTGLTNIRRRLKTLYGDRASLVAGEVDGTWRALLVIPLSSDVGTRPGGHPPVP